MLGLLFGATTVDRDGHVTGGFNLVALLSIIGGVILLFGGVFPRPLFALIVGFNRWLYRVIAYAALMTDVYQPFRLDQGGSEPPASDQERRTSTNVVPTSSGIDSPVLPATKLNAS